MCGCHKKKRKKKVFFLRPYETSRVFRCHKRFPVAQLFVKKNEVLIVICKKTKRRHIFICSNTKGKKKVVIKRVDHDFKVTCI